MKRLGAGAIELGHSTRVLGKIDGDKPPIGMVRKKVLQPAYKNAKETQEFEIFDGTNWVPHSPGHNEKEALLARL